MQSENSEKGLDVSKFVTLYGKLSYTIDGTNKKVYLSKQVKPQKVKSKNYYFEVPMEVLYADNVELVFNMRGQTLKYRLK